jgi:hypothetical protein
VPRGATRAMTATDLPHYADGPGVVVGDELRQLFGAKRGALADTLQQPANVLDFFTQVAQARRDRGQQARAGVVFEQRRGLRHVGQLERRRLRVQSDGAFELRARELGQGEAQPLQPERQAGTHETRGVVVAQQI